jgi:hypothetical protein
VKTRVAKMGPHLQAEEKTDAPAATAPLQSVWGPGFTRLQSDGNRRSVELE